MSRLTRNGLCAIFGRAACPCVLDVRLCNPELAALGDHASLDELGFGRASNITMAVTARVQCSIGRHNFFPFPPCCSRLYVRIHAYIHTADNVLCYSIRLRPECTFVQLVHIHLLVSIPVKHASIRNFRHPHIHACMRACRHSCIHTYLHTHTSTYILTLHVCMRRCNLAAGFMIASPVPTWAMSAARTHLRPRARTP